MAGHGWSGLVMSIQIWQWLVIAGYGWSWLVMAGHGWSWLVMAGQDCFGLFRNVQGSSGLVMASLGC
jgi:hypothetical protein